MLATEIEHIINTCPYNFSKEEVPNPTIILQENIWFPDFHSTPAMLWIIRWKSEPPEVLRHDPAIQSFCGYTCAMIWIVCVNTEPPEWMRHDPTIITNNIGETCEMLWIRYCNGDVPEYLRHDTSIKNPVGETSDILWSKYRNSDVPEYLRQNKKITNTTDTPLVINIAEALRNNTTFPDEIRNYYTNLYQGITEVRVDASMIEEASNFFHNIITNNEFREQHAQDVANVM